MTDIYWLHTWVIDWSKIKTVEDIKEILICADCKPNPDHPNFYIIRDKCKLINRDGKELDPKTLLPKGT